MNNKGQALNVFLFMVPLVLISAVILINYGFMIYQMNEIDDTVEMAIEEYYDKGLTKNETLDLIDKNIDYENLTVIVDKKLIVLVEVEVGKLYKYDCLIRYVGSNLDGELEVVKEMN